MPDTHDINLKVLVMDTDYYALHSINGFLAWDRRTRVTDLCESLNEMLTIIDQAPVAEQPDIVVMEADHLGGPDGLRDVVAHILRRLSKVRVICMTQIADPDMAAAAAEAGAHGFLLKGEVRLQIAWAIVYSLNKDFVITAGIRKAVEDRFNRRLHYAAVLPEMRKFPELTGRIRQAIQLCVVEGMPAHLAADEMGISLHTIRGYIKEGYRILEAYDETEYPIDMTPQERAFMRFTAFANESNDDSSARH
jgi:DNA-binding NarL/FixJ family response regulator